MTSVIITMAKLSLYARKRVISFKSSRETNEKIEVGIETSSRLQFPCFFVFVEKLNI